MSAFARAGDIASGDSDADLMKKAAELKERGVVKAESLDKYDAATKSNQERRVGMMHKACQFRLGAGTSVANLMVILEDGVDVDAELKLAGDPCALTPVFRAANAGHERAVMCLIQNGCNYEKTTAVGKLLPLHAACKQGNKNAVEYLVLQGADFGSPCADNKTPWKYAFDRHDDKGKDCMYILEREGAVVEEQEKCTIS